MVFYLMMVLFICFILSTIVMVYLLLGKDGFYVSSKRNFIVVQMFILVGLYINVTALPSNYYAQIYIDYALIAIAIGSVFLYKQHFLLARLLLAMTGLISMAVFIV